MRWAVVTGATSGLGREIAWALERSGWGVMLSGRKLTELNRTVAGFEGANWYAVPGDIRNRQVLDDMHMEALRRKVSLLVNCAGLYVSGMLRNLVEQDIEDVISTNLTGTILMTRKMWPILTTNKGQVVMINSIAARRPKAEEQVYAATKAGLEGFSRALRLEAMRTGGPRVIDVFVGAMATPMAIERGVISPEEVAQRVVVGLIDSSRTEYVSEIEINRVW